MASIDQVRNWTSTALSLLIGIAGWYYLFYSRAAGRLAVLEQADLNKTRVILRRINGLLMILLGVLLYVGTQRARDTSEVERHPAAYLIGLLTLLVLLMIIVLLALIDLRMTMQLRRRRDDKSDRGGQ